MKLNNVFKYASFRETSLHLLQFKWANQKAFKKTKCVIDLILQHADAVLETLETLERVYLLRVRIMTTKTAL